MRPLSTAHPALAAAAVVSLAVVSGSTPRAAVASTPPTDEIGTDQALVAFEKLADRFGITLIDPVCVETVVAQTFTCYGSAGDGSLFVATAPFLNGVPDWEILNRPPDAGGAGGSDSTDVTDLTEPDAAPSTEAPAEAASFDPLDFFGAVFMADLAQLDEQRQWVQPDSPADAYLDFQELYLAAVQILGGEIDRGYVYLTPDEIRVCLDDASCYAVTDLEVEEEQLVSFTIDGEPLAERLGRPGEPIRVGTTTVHLGAAYQTVNGDHLAALVAITPGGDAVGLSTAVYVDGDGNQTPIDRDLSFGLVDGRPSELTIAMLAFPDAAPGGEIRFLVSPPDGSTPYAAVIPVEAFPTGAASGPSSPSTPGDG